MSELNKARLMVAMHDFSHPGWPANNVDQEGLDALESVVPALDRLGWAVVKEFYNEGHAEKGQKAKDFVEGISADDSAKNRYEQVKRLAALYTDLFFALSVVNCRGISESRVFSIKSKFSFGIEPTRQKHHYDFSGHSFLNNPYIRNDMTLRYLLGSEEDMQIKQYWRPQIVEVGSRDLLILAGGALKQEIKDSPRKDHPPEYGSVRHHAIRTRRRRIRAMYFSY